MRLSRDDGQIGVLAPPADGQCPHLFQKAAWIGLIPTSRRARPWRPGEVHGLWRLLRDGWAIRGGREEERGVGDFDSGSYPDPSDREIGGGRVCFCLG